MSSKRSLDENTTVDEENKENVETTPTPVKRSKSDSQESSIDRLEKQLFKNETFNAANETSNEVNNENQTNETINYESGRNESAVETSMEEKSNKDEMSMVVDENNNLDLDETKKSQLKGTQVKNEVVSCSSSNSSLVDLSNASFEADESQTQSKQTLESTRVKLEDNVNQTIAQENEDEQEKTIETEAELEPKPAAVAEPIRKIRKKRSKKKKRFQNNQYN